MILPPINLQAWIEEHRHLLKPPVGNQVVYRDSEFIIMVVGGPNARKEFHYNQGEEFFYQLKGDMVLPIRENGKRRDIVIREGEIFLLPAGVEHSPQRYPDTIGLVIERTRQPGEKDACSWYCENCNELLYRVSFDLHDIVTELPQLIESFYNNADRCTCKHCGTVMQPPALKQKTI